MSKDEVSPHVSAQIDKGLRRVFEKHTQEEIPDHLKELIAKLSEADSSKGDDEDPS